MKKKEFKAGYLAPLTYDRFFKKVFSKLKIAKAFLEDFLDIEIQEIEKLENVNNLTKESQKVKFDFRCKVDNKHIIIEMQQWEKQDIVQRFLTYLAVNIALQLENMPEKHIRRGDTTIEIKDYRRLEPTITLVWLVDDDFKIDKNFLSYSIYPDSIADFIRDTELWNSNEIEELKNQREELLKLLNKKHRSLDFLQKNKLVFMLHPNIIKNKKNTKYRRWFDFAEKTRDFNNKNTDFVSYQKDPIFNEIINVLITKLLDKKQFNYLKEQKKINDGVRAYETGVYEYGFIDGVEEEKLKSEKKINEVKIKLNKIEEEKLKAEEEKLKAEEEKLKAEEELSIFRLHFMEKKSIAEISKITKKSKNTIKQTLNNKK